MASSMVTVPVPLSVAPDEPSQESKCADSITYSSGFSTPLIVAIVLNTGRSPRSSRVEVEAEDRVLVVLREAIDQAVVLAAERDRRRFRIIRLENLDSPPTILGSRRDDAGDARLLEPQAQLSCTDREAIPGATDIGVPPIALHCGAHRVHPRPRFRCGVLFPIVGWQARWLQTSDQNEFPFGAGQPFHELRAVREPRENHGRRRQIPLPGTRAVPEHRSLQRPDAGLDQIECASTRGATHARSRIVRYGRQCPTIGTSSQASHSPG